MRRLLIVLVACTACTDHVQLGKNGIPGLSAIEVSPGDTTYDITDLLTPPQSIPFIAIGVFDNGMRRDVTKEVAWSVDNPAPGNFLEPGNYLTSGTAAGHVLVHATAGEIVGEARLTVTISATIVDSAFPPPPGAGALFGSMPVTDPMRSPQILYPAAETMFPQGIARMLFQFARGTGNDAFRLGFDSDVLHLAVLTGTDRWQPDDLVWKLITQSHPDASVVLSLQAAASTMPGTVYGGAPETLDVAKAPELDETLLYFWSAATSGVMRGQLAATGAGKLYPGDSTCVGCHAVSRSGAAMAMGYGGEVLQTIDTDMLGTEVSATQNLPMGWATYSPDGTLVLVADKGVLTLRNATTGMPVGPMMGKVPLMSQATHPDWSPDGTTIAVALAASSVTNQEVKNASIATIPYNNGRWGTPRVIVAAAGGADNNYFPKWSPDGKFIAYVNANDGSHGAASAELRLIAAEGGVPLRLRVASHRLGGIDDVPDLADTMPAWAPAATANGVSWLAFASNRPYGVVRPMLGSSQIWIAAVYTTHAGDPSFAAFWLPCQDITDLANNPVWALPPSINPG